MANDLRQRMEQLLRIRNYSERTVETYVGAMIRYASYWRHRPDELGEREVRSYQIWLRDVHETIKGDRDRLAFDTRVVRGGRLHLKVPN